MGQGLHQVIKPGQIGFFLGHLALVQEIFDIIRNINKEGMTILLVEQNAQMALSVADRAYVLETGRVVMDGTGAELLTNERVRSAYLGG